MFPWNMSAWKKRRLCSSTNSWPGRKQDEFILILGQVAPPLFAGTPEEQLVKLRTVTSVRSNVVARFALTRTRLDELIATLEDIRTRADASRPRG